MEEMLNMNKKERERIKILVRLVEGTLTQKIAAKQLNCIWQSKNESYCSVKSEYFLEKKSF